MTQEEDAHSSKSTSAIHINIKSRPSTSSLPKEHTADNTSSAVIKPQSPPETFYPSTVSQKVPPSATLNRQSEIRDLTPAAQEPTPLSSVTLMMEPRPESDYPQVPERPFPEAAEPQSESSLEEVETRNPS